MRMGRVAVLGSLLVLPLAAGAFLRQNKQVQDGARLFAQVLQRIEDNSVDSLSRNAIYEKAARGLVRNLKDPYADLYSPEELASFQRNTLRNNYGGLGMQIEPQDDQIVISRVFPNTPAAMGGLQAGDHIIMVDTTSVIGFTTTRVSDLLVGQPGTSVEVTVRRSGVMQPIKGRFTRAIIRVPAVPFTLILEGNVGYIPLQAFNDVASEDVGRALLDLKSRGARSFVLDLRNNGGGSLDQALDISNLFLRAGQEISRVRHRGREPEVYTANRPSPLVDSMPLVVLEDGNTASASEIVAGSLQDHDRALVVGTTSFGKGLVQTLFPLDGGWAVKLTTGKWYTPSGRSIQAEHDRLGDDRFVEYDSTTANDTTHKRPVFKSDAGRTILGGGGITPDIVITPDSGTTAERDLGKAIAPTIQAWHITLYNFALEQKPRLKQDFVITQEMRDEVFSRLVKAKVAITRAQYDAGRDVVDRNLERYLATAAFGDSTYFRRSIKYDDQMKRTLELLGRGPTQRQLLAMAKSGS